MAKMITREDVKRERDQLKKQIDGGKLKGKALKKATGRMYYLNGRLAHAFGPKKVKAAKIDPSQGFIPGFLSQMNITRIEELIADKAFNAVRSELEKSLGITIDKKKVG